MVNLNGHVQPAKTTDYRLIQADANAVRSLWSTFIRPGLERIKAKDKHSGFWQPEHVRQQLEAGFKGLIFCECQLIIDGERNIPVGFIVLKSYNDEFIGVPTSLFVWLVWCEGAPAWRVVPHVLPALEQRARDLGLRKVQGVTSRDQWMRRLVKMGYNLGQMVIEKEVTKE